MSAKAIVVVCAQALFAHAVMSQCCQSRAAEHTCGFIAPSCGSHIGNGYALGSGLGLGIGAGAGIGGAGLEAALANGGGFPILSSTSIAPNGISVASENGYEGSLNVIGELPFLSTIGFEGVLPSAGAGAVHYGCGNGITAITSEVGNSAGANGFGFGGIGSGVVGIGSAGIGSGVTGCGSILGHSCGHAVGRHCGCGLY